MQKIKTNPRRVLSLLLTLCFVLSLFPALSVPARAAEGPTRITALDLTSTSVSYDAGNESTLTKDPTTENITDTAECWKWYLTETTENNITYAAKTLVLYGLVLEADANGVAALKVPAGTTIVLDGANSIGITGTGGVKGIVCAGDLAINGDESDSLTVSSGTSFSPYGMVLEGKLTVNGCQVTIDGQGSTAIGLSVTSGIEVTGTGFLTVKAQTGTSALADHACINTTNVSAAVVGGTYGYDNNPLYIIGNNIRMTNDAAGAVAKCIKFSVPSGGEDGGGEDDGTWTYPSGPIASPFAGGNGESGNPYQIATAQQLANLAYLVNTDNATYGSKHYKLTANIDLGGSTNGNWTPIGWSSGAPVKFMGTFDGDGYEVQNIYINSDNQYQGLFGYVGDSTGGPYVIKNLGVTGSITSTNAFVGGIAGILHGYTTVENCYNTAAITAQRNLGGIVGSLSSQSTISVKNCFNTGTITSTIDNSNVIQLGGIVGNISSGGGKTVENCYNTGNLVAAAGSGSFVGGIVGYMNSPGTPASTVKNCVSLGSSIATASGNQTDLGRILGGMASGAAPERNYARSDMLVNDATVSVNNTSGTHGGHILLGSNVTFQDIFTSGGVNFDTTVWEYTKLTVFEVDAQLPMLRGFKTGTTFYTDAPTIPGADEGGGGGDDTDTTAPVLTLGTYNRTSDTAATIGFTTDEAGSIHVMQTTAGNSALDKDTVVVASSLGNATVGANSGIAIGLSAGDRDVYVVVKDTAGNISEPLKIEVPAYGPVDTTPPVLQSASIIGNQLTLTFNEDISDTITASDISINRNGAPSTYATGTGVSVADSVVTVTMDNAVDAGDTVTVTFSGSTIKDTSNNYHAGVTGETVTNNTPPKYHPLTLSGFNADVVAEAYPVTSSTSTSFDTNAATPGWASYVLYSNAYVAAYNSGASTSITATGGLPDDGVITADNSAFSEELTYQLAAYDGNNAFKLTKSTDSGTLTLNNPAAYPEISILGTSATGNSTMKVTLNFADGTTQEQTFSCLDWFSSNDSAVGVFGTLGRAIRVRTNPEAGTVGEPMNRETKGPKLYEYKFSNIDEKLIESITFTQMTRTDDNFTVTTILAVSGIGSVDVSPAPLAAPTITPNGGSFSSSQTVTITAGEDATIYYTTDGSTPTAPTDIEGQIMPLSAGSTKTYTEPFTISETTTVKAIAVKSGETSVVASATFTKQSNNPGGGSTGGGGTTTTTTIPADTESKSTPVEITTSGNDVTLKLPDSKVEDIVKSADENVTFDLSKVKNAETAIIPIKAVETLSEENIGITVKLPEADITIAAEDLQDLADDAKAGENLRVEAEYISPSNLTAEQKAAVEGKRVIDINVFLGTRKVDVPVTVSIPYELADGEDPDGVCVWYMDDKGNLTKMTGSYDTKTGLFTFYTDHQSYYLIGYEQPENHLCDAFTDIKGHWGFDAICYMAENGIMNGTSSTTFAPNTNLSRAMMVQILWNLEGKPVAGSATFTDVASGAWYADAVAWAASKGIVNGYGNGLFGPDDSITREQMVTILRNYAEFKGMDVSATNDLASFGDAGAASGWALSSIQWAVEEEIIGGRPGGLIDPKGTATRAEIAQMMMNFMTKMK